MMQEGFSPEEKLLKLIRGDKKQKDKQPADKVELTKKSDVAISAQVQKQSLSVAAKPVVPKTSLGILNLVLVVVLILVILYLIFDIAQFRFKGRGFLKENIGISVAASAKSAEKVKSTQEVSTPGFEDYSRVIAERELFKPQRSGAQTEKVYNNQLSGYDDFKNLSLIGIIGGEKPQAIIEDKESKKSYFLFKGQTINQIKVEDILEGRVILNFNGQTLELTL